MSFVNQEMDDRGSILSEKGDLLNESMQSFKSKEIFEPNVVRPNSPGLSDIRLSVNLKQEGNDSVNNSISQIELPGSRTGIGGCGSEQDDNQVWLLAQA